MQATYRMLIGVLASALAGAAPAETWQLATAYGDDSFQTANVRHFADDVQAVTAGALRIDVRAGGELFGRGKIKDAVGKGTVPMGEFLLSGLGREHAIFEVDSVPFLASNYPKARKLWKASRPAIESRLAAEGIKVLFAVPWPPQGIYTQKPLAALSDLSGAGFRTYNPITERLATLVGAKPVPVEPPGIAAAFRSGEVAAMASSPTIGVETHAWEYVRYFYHAKAWLPKNVVVVNASAFAKLDERTRRMVESAAKLAEDRGWRASEKATDAALDVLRDRGVGIYLPDAPLRAELADVGRRMTFEWTDRAGDLGVDVIERFYALE